MTATQREIPRPTTMHAIDWIRYAMHREPWWTYKQLQNYLKQLPMPIYLQETTVSARIRDLRKEGYTVEAREVKGKRRLYEFRLVPGSNEPQGRLF